MKVRARRRAASLRAPLHRDWGWGCFLPAPAAGEAEATGSPARSPHPARLPHLCSEGHFSLPRGIWATGTPFCPMPAIGDASLLDPVRSLGVGGGSWTASTPTALILHLGCLSIPPGSGLCVPRDVSEDSRAWAQFYQSLCDPRQTKLPLCASHGQGWCEETVIL